MKNLILSLFACALPLGLSASKIDTVSVHSKSMDKVVRVVTVVPEAAKDGDKFPVVYLLHGYSGNHRSWVALKPELSQMADRDGIIFVCPDGLNSWYWDSPENKDMRYETFISSELVEYVDENMPSMPHREKRAIAGLSMGGHGALWNAIRHKDVFGAAGSTSGGVDIRPFPKNWEMASQLGEMAGNKDRWEAHTVINQLDSLKDGELEMLIDCGYDDFFREVNDNLHRELMNRKISHEYQVRPGKHDGPYWYNSIDYHILFFSKYFSRK